MISSVKRTDVWWMDQRSVACSLPDGNRCRPRPFPTPHSGIAGSALQPSFEFCGKGGTPQDQSRVLPNGARGRPTGSRSEEHTSELQSHHDLVCRLLLEKKKNKNKATNNT